VRRVLPAGMVLTAAGLLLYAQLPVDGHYFWDLFPAFVLGGAGMGLSFVPVTIASLSGVTPGDGPQRFHLVLLDNGRTATLGDEVGRDAVRFDMLYRKNDAVLDFDLAKVIEHSRENPVFYVQYGHARGQSVFRNARGEMPDLPTDPSARAAYLRKAPLEKLTDTGEVSLLRRIALFPRLVEAAAAAHEPHRIAFYLYELASEFHAHWTKGNDLPNLRFIIQNDRQTTAARLALVEGIITILASGLALLGVSAPDEMR